MTIRPYLLATITPVLAVGYESQPTQAAVDLATAAASDGLRDEKFEARSKDSAWMLKYWNKVDAVIGGIETMRDHAEEFLPKFRDEDDHDYQFRKGCTKFTNVYSDIVEGLAAKPFEQEVSLIGDQTDKTEDTDESGIPEAIRKFVWDVDGSGNNLTVFAAHTFFQGINNALDWIMVDHDKRDPTVRSVADMKRRGLRPYWSHILARNVLDVRSKMVGGDEVLTYIKIFEPGDPDHIREFARTDTLDARGNPVSQVVWRLWKKVTEGVGKRRYVLEDSGDVSIGVIPLVPFVTGRRDGRQWRFTPPMRAAVELSINLFKQESELEYKATMSAYSMLAGNGIEPPKGPDGKPNHKLAVGPARVLWSPPRNDGGPAGKWEWIEPSSEVLKFLEDRVGKTIQNLRELGRQPLTASSSNITVITAAVAAGKAKSAVKAWAYGLKDTIENALLLTAMWMALDYDPTVHVFAEFDDWMEGEDLEALDKARERGDISHETYTDELKRRGVLSSNFTIQRERVRLMNDLPGDDEDIDA